MDIIIHPSKLKDETLKIHGHKHSFVQIVAASIILNQICTIRNVPLVEDVFVLIQIINSLGGNAYLRKHTVHIDPRKIKFRPIENELMYKIHGSIYLIPALALRFGKLVIYKTGGCQIGSAQNSQERPHHHIKEILKYFNFFSKTEELGNKNYFLDIQKFSDNKNFLSGELISSATKIAILCSLTKRKTVISNPYLKTDVLDLLAFIKKCGFHTVMKKNTITIFKPSKRKKTNVCFTLSDCPTEIISYITLALLSGISLKLEVTNASFVKKIIIKEIKFLKRMRVDLKFFRKSIRINKQNKDFAPVDIEVTHTSFQSDHHPFFTLLLLSADGISTLTEHVWKNRFGYVEELKKLSARIEKTDNKITIFPSQLKNALSPLNGLDTRASAVLIFAALMLKSSTLIHNVEHINRGYDNFWGNLKKMNAKIEVLK